jgi:tetratricopeptide (TPR) repeat protein
MVRSDEERKAMTSTSNDQLGRQLDHFVRFRDQYPDSRIHGVLAELFMRHPGDAAVHAALGRFCTRIGLVEEAHRFYQSAIEKGHDPEIVAAARLGRSALLKDEADALRRLAREQAILAADARRPAVALEPGSAAALVRCAEALAAAERPEEAGRLQGRAERLDPQGVAVVLGRVALALRDGRADVAAAALAGGLDANPRSPVLLEALIGVEEQRGRPDAVIDACLHLLKLSPYNPPVARRLSDACGRQDWFEAALRAHQTAPAPTLDPSVLRRVEARPPRRAGERRVRFVSFAAGHAFERAQDAIVASALRHGATDALPWGRADLEATDFYAQHRAVLDRPRGVGYWLWKPFIILQALLAADEGDWIWYHDAGLTIDADVSPIVDWADAFNDGLMPGIHLPCYTSKDWTKRDCYALMGCDEERYWNHCLIQPGWSFWRKSERSIRIVTEWLSHATDPRILTDWPNTCGLPNRPGFIDHRHDQSVFTVLFAKLELTTFGAPTDPLPRYPKDIRFLAERVDAFLKRTARA